MRRGPAREAPSLDREVLLRMIHTPTPAREEGAPESVIRFTRKAPAQAPGIARERGIGHATRARRQEARRVRAATASRRTRVGGQDRRSGRCVLSGDCRHAGGEGGAVRVRPAF
jgi:hypothetical protein